MLGRLATKTSDEAMATINALEKDLRKMPLAVQCHNLRPSDLSRAKLERIKKVEDKLGVSFVAAKV